MINLREERLFKSNLQDGQTKDHLRSIRRFIPAGQFIWAGVRKKKNEVFLCAVFNRRFLLLGSIKLTH